MVKWRQFHTEDRQILGATIQNLMSQNLCTPVLRHTHHYIKKTGATKCLYSFRKTYDWNSGITYNLDGTISSDSSPWGVSHVETSCDHILPRSFPFTGCNHVVISHSAPKRNNTSCWCGSYLSLTRNSGRFLSALLEGGRSNSRALRKRTDQRLLTHALCYRVVLFILSEKQNFVTVILVFVVQESPGCQCWKVRSATLRFHEWPLTWVLPSSEGQTPLS
jgi:hypothetical protein